MADDRRASFKDPNTTPDISVYWISTYYADPHNWIGEMFHSSNAGTFKNATSLQEPEGGRAPGQGRCSRPTRPTRAKLYEEAVRIVVADAPGLWIYNTKWYGPYSKKLKGIVFCPIGNAQEMRTAYYESETPNVGAQSSAAGNGLGLGLRRDEGHKPREMRILALIAKRLAWFVPTLRQAWSPSCSSSPASFHPIRWHCSPARRQAVSADRGVAHQARPRPAVARAAPRLLPPALERRPRHLASSRRGRFPRTCSRGCRRRSS